MKGCFIVNTETTQLEMFTPSIGLGGIVERPALDRNTVAMHHDAQHTSFKAAIKVLPKTGTYRQRVYQYLLAQSATDEEIETALGMSGNTVRPTRGSLVKDGYIKDSKQTRLTRAGNDAIVWQAV